jgi:hypothetical protein
MIGKSNKKYKKSSTDSKGIYSRSPSLKSKIRFFLVPANVKLILTLHNVPFDGQIQKDLDKILGSGNHLPRDIHELDGQFNRYIWELHARDGGAFKSRLSKYKNNHPEVNIHAEDINSYLLALHWTVYIIGGIAGVAELIVIILHWIFHLG